MPDLPPHTSVRSYRTTSSTTRIPISEGGMWINGPTDGHRLGRLRRRRTACLRRR